MAQPLLYYQNNILGMLNLLEVGKEIKSLWVIINDWLYANTKKNENWRKLYAHTRQFSKYVPKIANLTDNKDENKTMVPIMQIAGGGSGRRGWPSWSIMLRSARTAFLCQSPGSNKLASYKTLRLSLIFNLCVLLPDNALPSMLPNGVLLFMHGLRRARVPPHHGVPSHGQHHQRLRPDQVLHRGNAQGLECCW